MLAALLAGADDEAGGDLAQREAFVVAQAPGGGEHVLVGDLGTADRLALGAGGLLAFEGLVADVVALGLGHGGEEGEQGGAVAGRVVLPGEGAGEELQLDLGVAQFLGDLEQLQGAAAQALHLVHHEGDLRAQ